MYVTVSIVAPSICHETWVQSLGWEDLLEKKMATHSSTPAWKIPWTEEPGWLQSMGWQRVGHDRVNNTSLHICHEVMGLNVMIFVF